MKGLWGSARPLSDGSMVTVDAAYVTAAILDPARQIAAGFPPSMPSYAGKVEERDLADLIALIGSLR